MVYKKQKGFTIIELMIAITVFSVAILLVTTGVISIGREYRLGATKAKLNTLARELHAQFTQEIQYAGNNNTPITIHLTSTHVLHTTNNFDQVVCIGKTRYLTKDLDQSNPSGNETLAYDKVTNMSECATQSFGEEGDIVYPLPKDARMTEFEVTETSGIYSLLTRIVIGQQDMFEPNPPDYPDGDYTKGCKSDGGFGSAFCSVIILKSEAARKVN